MGVPRSPKPDERLPPVPWLLEAPAGLRVAKFQAGAERLAVLSFPAPTFTPPACLTAAERVVAAALLEGRSNVEIARARRTSARTVANQVASVMRKLGVGSRVEAAAVLARPRG